MPELSLRERAEAALTRALAATAQWESLRTLRSALVDARAHLDRPMTVAIVGRIKSGKSTMTNALLGEHVAATAAIECTYNVNWFRYGDERTMTVHYRNGRAAESRPVDELAAHTNRIGADLEGLADIDFIDVRLPSDLLRRFSLVDTPGLDSAHVTDADNTARFLGLRSSTITERTQHEAQHADAVLYLFSKGLAASGASVLEELAGPTFGRATPLNAIGVLTKVDMNWRSSADPLSAGTASAASWMTEPTARRLFFAIRPTCAVLALAATSLTPANVDALAALASLDDKRVAAALASFRRFAAADFPGIELSRGARLELFDRLGPYGILVATRWLRAGGTDRNGLAHELEMRSGVPDLIELIVSHFGNRAMLIKLDRIVGELRARCLRERGTLQGDELRALRTVDDELDRLWASEHGFAELTALRRYYEGALDLTPSEVTELLDVTGESGTELEHRLGREPGCSPVELIADATRRAGYWAQMEFAPEKATRETARTLRRSYERLAALARERSSPVTSA